MITTIFSDPRVARELTRRIWNNRVKNIDYAETDDDWLSELRRVKEEFNKHIPPINPYMKPPIK